MAKPLKNSRIAQLLRFIAPICVIFLQLIAVNAEAPNPSVDSVLKSYTNYCNSVPSFDLVVIEKGYPKLSREGKTVRELTPKEVNQPPFVQRSRQRSSRHMYRIDVTESKGISIPEGSNVVAWNGVQESSLNISSKKGAIAHYARSLPSPCGFSYLNLYETMDGDTTYAKLIAARTEVTVESVDGQIRITACPAPGAKVHLNTFGVQLYFAPAKGFVPEQINLLVPGRGGSKPYAVATSIKNELEEIEPGLWLPIRALVSNYLVDPGSAHSGKELNAYEIEVDRARSNFHAALDPSIFTLEFPDGIEVFDRTRGDVFLTGSDKKSDYLAFLARQGRLTKEQLSQFRQRSAPESQSNDRHRLSKWRALLIANLVAAGILIAILGIRHTRRRKTRAS